MSEPFLGEVMIVSFGFAPRGWALCNGQLLPINQNQALFSLLGTTFGGDGRVNFALPDLRARVPIHEGAGHTLGERAGEAAHTLTLAELPAHTHLAQASALTGNDVNPAANLLAGPLNLTYRPQAALAPMDAGSVAHVGGSQAHLNQQPHLALMFVIALQGIFPSPN
jgi:microcystin-dependent protein